MKINIYDIQNLKPKPYEVNKNFESFSRNDKTIFRTIIHLNNNKRQNTAKTKTRAEVSGGGKKPWKQKGTGNARHGSTRSPIWKKGGVVFGPNQQRNYVSKVNKKEKALALKTAIHDKLVNNNIKVVNDFNFKVPKTKEALQIISKLKISDKKILVIIDKKNINTEKSFSNIPNCQVIHLSMLSLSEIVKYQIILTTENCFKLLEGKFNG